MKIYDDIGTPNSKRVRIFLAEKNLNPEFEQVTVIKSEHFSEEFKRKNPFTYVPVLELDDGSFISETIAICRYFEVLNPNPALFGDVNDAKNLAQIEMWQRWAELNIFLPIMHCFRHKHPRMAHLEVPQIGEWGEANCEKANKRLDILEDVLKNSEDKYLVGNELSIADITLFIAIWFCRAARIDAFANRDYVKSYFDRLLVREAFSANI